MKMFEKPVISPCMQELILSKHPPEKFTRRNTAGYPGDAGSDP
jgi:hypothetical protein